MTTLEVAKYFAGMAVEDDMPRCIYGEHTFFLENDKALIPGHIYSREGLDEMKISRCCEYHFDKMFGDDDAEV